MKGDIIFNVCKKMFLKIFNFVVCSFSHILILARLVRPWRYKKRWSNKNFNLHFAADTVLPPLSVAGAY